jgi:secreted trypsin-like serine protease
MIVAGWGTTTFGGSSPDLLMQASILLMDRCKHIPSYHYDDNKQICAGNHEYTKDSCQGDSGGPLMYEVNNVWTVAGVVSFGDGCAKQGSPGVYARVQHYEQWIQSKVASA